MTGNKDWHPADIIAGLRKRETSLAAVSRKSGLASSTLSNVLFRVMYSMRRSGHCR